MKYVRMMSTDAEMTLTNVLMGNKENGKVKMVVVASAIVHPNDEIWYTTTDGNKFTTYTDDEAHTPIIGYMAFMNDNSIFDETEYVGPSVVSERFEDGVWKVKFSSDIIYVGSLNGGGNIYPYFATGDSDDNLKSVIFPPSVKTIGVTFWTNTELTSVTIHEGVTTIGDYAFMGSSVLVDLTLPVSLTSIGSSVFYYCQSLTTLNYAGTKEQWYGVTKAEDWAEDSSITKVHCSDGDLTGESIKIKPIINTDDNPNYDTFDDLLND